MYQSGVINATKREHGKEDGGRVLIYRGWSEKSLSDIKYKTLQQRQEGSEVFSHVCL